LQVDFPAVTICSPGTSNENLESGFYRLFLSFLDENDEILDISPYAVSALLKKVLNSDEIHTYYTQMYKREQGGVVKVEIYEVDTKIALYVDTFWLQL